MILVDTSVWIDHFRVANLALAAALNHSLVLTHPFVIGELACGNLKNRRPILDDLRALPLAVAATDDETLRIIESHRLWSEGVGWVDVHLLASALLSNSQLWTRDRPLERMAARAAVKLYREGG